MRNKKSVLMTLNHNFGCFSGVGSGIAGNQRRFASGFRACSKRELGEGSLVRVKGLRPFALTL